MFVIRDATIDDHAVLIKLWTTSHFAGHPADPVDVAEEIQSSREAFSTRGQTVPERCVFVFVLEDTDSGATVGASTVRVDTNPLVALRVQKRELYSEALQTGQVHVTLRLCDDEGPSVRLDGHALLPPYRGHRGRLGALLSQVRLHYIGLHRGLFEDRVVAALTPPRPPRVDDLLWEHLGRRFVNLRFAEAERFLRRNNDFLRDLFPDVEIYASTLSPEARNLIGRVGDESTDARQILDAAGFSRSDLIDPLTGGPYWAARTTDVPLITRSRTTTLADPVREYPHEAIVSTHRDDRFRAITCRIAEQSDYVSMPGEAAGLLGVQLGDTVGVTRL